MAQCDDLGHGIKKVEPMTSKEVMRELIVFGLRMQAGVNCKAFFDATRGRNLEDALDMKSVKKLEVDGWVSCKWNGNVLDSIRTTDKGFALADHVASKLIA
jgi:coproporphyrinogen III oxidase-like Fe-S oxidoreductase